MILALLRVKIKMVARVHGVLQVGALTELIDASDEKSDEIEAKISPFFDWRRSSHYLTAAAF